MGKKWDLLWADNDGSYKTLKTSTHKKDLKEYAEAIWVKTPGNSSGVLGMSWAADVLISRYGGGFFEIREVGR